MLVEDIIEHAPSAASLFHCLLVPLQPFSSSPFLLLFIFSFYFLSFCHPTACLTMYPLSLFLSLGSALNYRDQEEQIYSGHVSSTSRQPHGSVGGEAGRITTESGR